MKNQCFHQKMHKNKFFQISTGLAVCLIILLSGCSQNTANMTPLQMAKRDYWVYVYEKKFADRTEHDRIRDKYLEISEELASLLHSIYFYEYGNKFGDAIGVSVSTQPILIAYLRVRYSYPDKTERELRELYRESIKRGEVKAVVRGKNWRWNPENGKQENQVFQWLPYLRDKILSFVVKSVGPNRGQD